jgi:hypothetical protein
VPELARENSRQSTRGFCKLSVLRERWFIVGSKVQVLSLFFSSHRYRNHLLTHRCGLTEPGKSKGFRPGDFWCLSSECAPRKAAVGVFENLSISSFARTSRYGSSFPPPARTLIFRTRFLCGRMEFEFSLELLANAGH